MIVEVKQYPDQSAASIGLDKHNKSKIPGTYDIIYPGRGKDGRFLTGIDEHAASINAIENQELREKRREEARKLKAELEGLINSKGLSLDATSKFWESYGIKLGDEFAMNLSNPADKLKYHVLLANGYVAPELGVVESPEYINAKYYISRKEEEAKGRMVTRKTKDQDRKSVV